MMWEGLAKRTLKLEKFFNVRKPKELNQIEWEDKLYELQQDWEEENQKEFPF